MVAEVATSHCLTWNPSRISCPAPFSALPCTTLRTLDSLPQELFFLGSRLARFAPSLGKTTPNPGWGFVKQLITGDLPHQDFSVASSSCLLLSALTHFTKLSACVLAGILYPKCKYRIFLKASYLCPMSLMYQNQSCFTFITFVTHAPRASPGLQIPTWSFPFTALHGPEGIAQPSSSSATSKPFLVGEATEPHGEIGLASSFLEPS